MHEAGVADRILEVVRDRATEAGATRVTVVELEIGEASDVSEAAIAFHWDELVRGTPAEGAELRFRRADDPTAFRLVAIEVPDG